MSDDPEDTWSTHEREYRIYKDRFLKRSLAPSEYKPDFRGQPHVPINNIERLRNEAECLQFIKAKTDIPVPDFLDAYDQDGSFYLWTRRVDGVPMKELSESKRKRVIIQLEVHLRTLRNLRSDRIGGPTGILCPPNIVTAHFPKEKKEWPAVSLTTKDFVFCHCDLSQSNIIVDPTTLQITAILDWEFSGYFPECFEAPYYRKPTPSGAQMKDFTQTKELLDFMERHNFGADH